MGSSSGRWRRRVTEGVLSVLVVLAAGDHLWPGPGTSASTGLVALVAVAIALLTRPARERLLPSPAATPAMLGMTWIAVFACVPETSDQMFHVAALLVVLGTVELLTRAPLPWWVHSGATAVLAWAGLYGSVGRTTAVVGALFALWPLVLPAIVVTAVPNVVGTATWVRWSVVLAAATASLLTARSGALGTRLWPALEDALLGALASTMVALPLAAWAAGRTRGTTTSTSSITTCTPPDDEYW